MMTETLQYPTNAFVMMQRVYRHILPGVREELNAWREAAARIPDAELRTQAMASIATKAFHCQGGSIYAAANLANKAQMIRLIVAFQTISDYLDNLCDRSTSMDAEDFRRLHQSMLDAVNPEVTPADYYAYRSEKDDGGYLLRLVNTCRSCIAELPSYSLVQKEIDGLVALYCDLQVYKHIHRGLRENALLGWWELHKQDYPHIMWNEFAAATGSTLGVFMLFLAASDPHLDQHRIEQVRKAYFPYVCGLHILLDYLIDQEEDLEGGDLNFCAYYGGRQETVERIEMIVQNARSAVMKLDSPRFHRLIIEGLLGLYLSDPKVARQPEVRKVSSRLMKKNPLLRTFFWLNSIWIRVRKH